MYYIIDGQKKNKESYIPPKPTHIRPVVKENFSLNNNSPCSKWVYIGLAIAITILTILLIIYLIKGDKKSRSPSKSSAKKRFGFRFY